MAGLFAQIPPTAGYPVHAADLLRLGKPGSLAEDVRELTGAPYTRITCSGTAALYVILESIKELTPKRTIVIPSFICPLVGLAVARANMHNLVCDMQTERLDYDMAQLETLCASPDIAAIVVPHLGGMPADMNAIRAITQKHGILLIEDCAQALGAEYQGQKTGTFGDFAFFSFARGKGLTLYEGGVLVTTHTEHTALLERKYHELVPKNLRLEIETTAGLAGYGLFYRPTLFWFIFDLTYNLWNWLGDEVKAASEYNRIDFPLYRMSRFRQKLGHVFFHRVRPQIARQWESAQRYFEALSTNPNFTLMGELPNTKATYPYVVLLFPTREKRDAMMKRLRAQGLGAFIIYIHALMDYPYMKPYLPDGSFPSAKRLADCTMTLTTNLFLRERDRAKIIALLNEAA